MYTYTVFQWIFFFMFYCLVGWIGESLYVSWEYKKWVNRGFINGPFLPIYGFGAIIMLFATLPVRSNILLIFLFGMLAATALEYFTGWAIEKLFKARYWDYTYQPFNLNGYICLGCSLTWGLCAILLIKIVHSPVEKLVALINPTLLIVIDIIFLVYFALDLSVSLRQAIDLRKLIVEFIENNKEIQRMQKRIDVLVAVIEDDKAKIRKRAQKMLNRNPGALVKKHRITFEDLKELINKI